MPSSPLNLPLTKDRTLGDEPLYGVGRYSIEGLGASRYDQPVQAHVHEHQVVSGELDTYGAAGGAHQAEKLTRPSALRRFILKRLQYALLNEAPRHLAHRGRAEIELTRDRCARSGPALTQQG